MIDLCTQDIINTGNQDAAEKLLHAKHMAKTGEPTIVTDGTDSEATLLLDGCKAPASMRSRSVLSTPTILPPGLKRLSSSASLGAPTVIGAMTSKRSRSDEPIGSMKRMPYEKTLAGSDILLPYEEDDGDDVEVKQEYDAEDPQYEEEMHMTVTKGYARSAGSSGLSWNNSQQRPGKIWRT